MRKKYRDNKRKENKETKKLQQKIEKCLKTIGAIYIKLFVSQPPPTFEELSENYKEG
jgi:hypothetical protein